jgi:hypothetical protein
VRGHKPSLPPTVSKPAPRSVMKPPPVSTRKAPPSGELPHPRRPRVVRDVGGGGLMDLFAMFPDLPKLVRPAPRKSVRRRVPVRPRHG